MATAQMTDSAKVRAKLDHPIVDADGHVVELQPVVLEYMKHVGGHELVEREIEPLFRETHTHQGVQSVPAMSPGERKDSWPAMNGWWSQPVDTLDRATVALPRLLSQRLDEFGVDYAILYPSIVGLFTGAISEPEVRRIASRGYNKYAAEVLGEFPDRMTGVGTIPLVTPEEAVEDLDYAVNELGLKAVVFSARAPRPIPQLERDHPEAASFARRAELFAIDSDYDYDKVWAKCVELGVAVTFHGGIQSPGSHSSSNYVFNHIGLLSKSHQQLCKALFMGGVTRRFPTLNFGFLEGGVGWAVSLFADMLGHWEKRNAETIHTLNPDLLDRDRLMELVEEYGDDITQAKAAEIREVFDRPTPRPSSLDDFAPCKIESPEDLRDLFVPRFFFGCEADDPVNPAAFNSNINPFGATMQIIYGTDIGHWDVPVMADVLKEAYEPVERGVMSPGEFKQFTFSNVARLHGGMNPDFFKGTRVEAEVGELLASGD
jgi:predicted TIM-barrel fold metal-dependent hydrolase